jgi:hypothetical protein
MAYIQNGDHVRIKVNSYFGGEYGLIDIEGVDKMQDDQTTTDEDTVEPEVGMMVRINQSSYWGEIIAIRRTPDIYRENEYYHIAYASDTGVKLACFRRRSNLQVEPICEYKNNNRCTVSDMLGAQKPSKYGSFADLAEAAIAAEVDNRPILEENKGLSRFRSFCADQDLYGSHLSKYLTPYIHMAQAEEEGANIKLYLTAKDRKRDRLTSMKPGRALRHMFPNAHDTKIASATEAWIESTQPRDFTLVVGKERIDFRNAYNGTRGNYRNPACKYNRKSLATSCMQDVVIIGDRGEHISPTEAYASGDFEIAYLTNGKEARDMRIFGRVVFAAGSAMIISGPVYGACEQSLDILHNYLNDRAVEDGHGTVEFDIDSGWLGLTLLAIRDRNDRLVGPYIDGCISGDLVGNFIELSSRGDLNFESTDGTIEQGCSCEHCGNGVSDDDSYFTDDGETLCETCFHETYVFLENGDTVRMEDATHANFYSGINRTFTGWFLMEEVVHCECVDDYWLIDDCTYAEHTDQFVPNNMVDRFPELFDLNDEEEEAA